MERRGLSGRVVVYRPPVKSMLEYMVNYITKGETSRVEAMVYVHMLMPEGCVPCASRFHFDARHEQGKAYVHFSRVRYRS